MQKNSFNGNNLIINDRHNNILDSVNEKLIDNGFTINTLFKSILS